MSSVAMKTQSELMKMLFFKIFNVFITILGPLNSNFDIAPYKDQYQTLVICKATVKIYLCKVLCLSLGGAVFK